MPSSAGTVAREKASKTADVSTDDWRMVLDWLPSGVPGLVPKRRLVGLSLRASDQNWSWGDGDGIAGSSEAVVMAVSGRTVALDDLSGSALNSSGTD